MPDLVARPLTAQALSELIDRKPHLLRRLATQLLPPPLAAIDPAERLGIDLSSLRTAEECRQVLLTVLAAIAHGEIAPAEAGSIARRVRARLHAVRRLARFERRLAQTKVPRRDGGWGVGCGARVGSSPTSAFRRPVKDVKL